MAIPTTGDDAGKAPAEPVTHDGAGLLRADLGFQLMVEAVQDYAIFLLSPEGNVMTWNVGAERIKGYSASEIVGLHFSRFYTDEDRAADRPGRLLGLARAHGRVEDEGWRVRKDGSRFWADVVVTALSSDAGAPAGFVKITRDLTERRAAEEQQRHLIAERRTREAAEDALKARDRFLSIASHELRTPIAALQLAVENLIHARQQGRLDEGRLARGLERVNRSAQRLGVLVNELLDVSRLAAEGQTLDRAPTDLVPIVRDVVARFADSVGEGRIRFESPESVIINADASRLDQVFTNLIDNALKYSPADATVTVRLSEEADGVEVSVADTGIGLDPDMASRQFEAFSRGRNVAHIGGLGLGLFISHRIVERHGGRIEAARRSDGPGSLVRVWLPRSES